MKLSPTFKDRQFAACKGKRAGRTYGATPATVGNIPLYKARKPPSVLYIVIMVAHMPGSLLLVSSESVAKDADCIDNRVRTISRG